MCANSRKTRIRSIAKLVALAFASTAVLGATTLLMDTSVSVASSSVPHGIIPIGSTNEGGSGAPSGPVTGILDISVAPCVGVATSVAEYETLRSVITLKSGSEKVAEWDAYGSQRIAWVEPVGTYRIRSNQPTVNHYVTIHVSSTRTTKVSLAAVCP